MKISEQLEVLSRRTFEAEIRALDLEVFQLNITRWCNQTCRHCHVDASPRRKEHMERVTIDRCLELISEISSVHTVDLTGGAPEGNPHFRYLVEALRKLDKKIIDRCNLTILGEPGFEDLPEFLAANSVELASSLPHFAASRTDKQRGKGVFEASIAGLKKLNAVGYGVNGSSLALHLVYNPPGVLLSGNQEQLEYEFRQRLRIEYGIEFTGLFCINNLPVNRFLESLLRVEKFDVYMDTLQKAFNPATLEGLMCRTQISVSWDGKVHDCDFNQMLGLSVVETPTLWDFERDLFLARRIRTGSHCLGCTAGAGSSCGGEISS